MFASKRAAALSLCILALGACRKNPAAKSGPTVDRGPVIDSHTLIVPLDGPIDTALKLFKRVGVVKFCNKNGGYLGSQAFAATLNVKHRLKSQFEFFVNVSWNGVTEPGWGDREAERLQREVGYGAKGIKFFKAMGLGARDAKGQLIHIDDTRFDPIMDRAAQVNAVVAIHVGDPKAFFEPPTPQNERYDELKMAPDWSFYGEDYPPLMELWKQTERLVSRHPKTTFLFIHMGLSEDLDYMEKLLDAHPNVYVDTSARVPEFGRHPVDRVRRFFLKFQDRILFGTDLSIEPDTWQLGSVSENARRIRGRSQILPGAFSLLRNRFAEHRPPDAHPGSLEGECHTPSHRCAAQALLRERRAAHLRPQGRCGGGRSSRRAAGIVDTGALTI